MEIIRGDIYWVDFATKEDSLQSGIRPAIVTSNDMCNKFSSIIHVIPLTSNTDKNPIPVHVEVGGECGLLKKSIALVEQETAIAKKRLGGKIGECTLQVMKQIEKAIQLQRGIVEPFSITEMLRLIEAINAARYFYDDDSNIVKVLKRQFINYCNGYGKDYKSLYVKYGQQEIVSTRKTVCV